MYGTGGCDDLACGDVGWRFVSLPCLKKAHRSVSVRQCETVCLCMHLSSGARELYQVACAVLQRYIFMQVVTLQSEILSCSFSLDTLAAVIPPVKEQHWEHATNTSIARLEEGLLKRAQSPALAQRIKLKPYELSRDMLQLIAGRPNAIIVGADGSQSPVRTEFWPGEAGTCQQVGCSRPQQMYAAHAHRKALTLVPGLHVLNHNNM